MVQSDVPITKARTNPNDNSGTAGVDGSVGVAGLDEGAGVGVEFGEAEFEEATFINALNASFGFPLFLKRPKLESALTV